MTTLQEYKHAETRFSALFDAVISKTGRYSDAAIREALTASRLGSGIILTVKPG